MNDLGRANNRFQYGRTTVLSAQMGSLEHRYFSVLAALLKG